MGIFQYLKVYVGKKKKVLLYLQIFMHKEKEYAWTYFPGCMRHSCCKASTELNCLSIVQMYNNCSLI